MSAIIHWLIEVTFDPDRKTETDTLMNDLIASSKSEAGVLAYELNVSSDGKTGIIHEKFTDSASVLSHIVKFGAFAERFMELCPIDRLIMTGNPDEKVKEATAGFGAHIFYLTGGFDRNE